MSLLRWGRGQAIVEYAIVVAVLVTIAFVVLRGKVASGARTLFSSALDRVTR